MENGVSKTGRRMKYGDAGVQAGLFYLKTVSSVLLEIQIVTFELMHAATHTHATLSNANAALQS